MKVINIILYTLFPFVPVIISLLTKEKRIINDVKFLDMKVILTEKKYKDITIGKVYKVVDKQTYINGTIFILNDKNQIILIDQKNTIEL